MVISCSKKLLALLGGVTQKIMVILIVSIAFIPLEQKTNFNRIKEHVKIKIFNVIMPFEDTKILEFNQYQKSDKAPFIIYADLECIIERIDGCKNNSENSSTTKVSNHIPSDFSTSTISSFRRIENKHDVYRGKDCMKKFDESLRGHAMKIINFKKKEMKLLTK